MKFAKFKLNRCKNCLYYKKWGSNVHLCKSGIYYNYIPLICFRKKNIIKKECE